MATCRNMFMGSGDAGSYEALAMAVYRQAAKDLALKRLGKEQDDKVSDPEDFLTGKDCAPVFNKFFPDLGKTIVNMMDTLTLEEIRKISKISVSAE